MRESAYSTKDIGMTAASVLQSRLTRGVLAGVLVWAFLRFLLPLTAPFLIAFLMISLFYPLLQRMQKRVPIRKKFLAIVVIVPFLVLFFWILWELCALGCDQLEKLPRLCTDMERQTTLFFHQCCGRLDGILGWKGQEIEELVSRQLQDVMDSLQLQIMPGLVSSSYYCFKNLFSFAGFLAVTLLAVFLMEKDYVSFLEAWKRSEDMSVLFRVTEGVLSYFVTFFKAQGVILAAISLLCIVTLRLASIEGALGLSLLAGFLDMMPFIGTGIVLVPLSLWQLVSGRYVKGLICILLYGVCAVLREWLEPKLIGQRVGIAPVWMLLGIYAGVKLFGASGIIKGPLGLVILYEILKTEPKKRAEGEEGMADGERGKGAGEIDE